MEKFKIKKKITDSIIENENFNNGKKIDEK